MMTAHCQRWTHRRTSYRPAGEPFRPDRHEVVILSESDAKGFCKAHHYSGTMPPARFRVGLIRKMPFEREVLAGCAVFSVPMQAAVLPRHLKADVVTGAELGRFSCIESVEGNGESWFLAAANRLLYRETPVRAVVTYADPMERVDEDGIIVKRGHVGTIYAAVNARMVGRSSPRNLILTRSGQVISGRTLSKIRNQETGAAYAYRQLLAAGAPEREAYEDPADYVKRALEEGRFLRQPHPGNYVYVYALGSAQEKRVKAAEFSPALPYPRLG